MVHSQKPLVKVGEVKMCGRFALTATPAEVEELFEIARLEPFPGRYNIAPTQPVCIVRMFGAGREGTLVRWGLVPHWVKDPASFSLLINARAETAAEKPAFRTAMRHRRCLIPASGFYEWQRSESHKQPFWIAPAKTGVVAFAGLWETWMGKDGSEIDTAAFLTTAANTALSSIHHRMPVAIGSADFGRWLDPFVEAREVQDLLRAAPDDYFNAMPVGNRVNSARNDGPDLQVPIEVGSKTQAIELDKSQPKIRKTPKASADDQMDLF